MKIELTEEQVFFIEKKLEELGLNYTPLQGEMLDHLCCMTEEEMQNGQTFENATQSIFEIFGKDELKKLQQQTIYLTHQKSSRMKNMVLAVLTLLLIPSSILFFSKKEKAQINNAILPPSPQEMMTVENLLPNQNEMATAITTTLHDPPSIKPLGDEFEINSGFGKRMHPVLKRKQFHSGIDFRAPMGTPVLATADGLVSIAKDNGNKGYGKHIIIQHDDEFKTHYSHLSKIKVKEGQKIQRGEVIGLVGSSGVSTAPHLHYEVIKNGKKVNPINYF